MDGKAYQWLHRPPLKFKLPNIQGKRILVTGGEGYVGRNLCKLSTALGAKVISYDLPKYDVLDFKTLQPTCVWNNPDIIFHLAAHKYATSAEEVPAEVAKLNIQGTQNVIEAAISCGASVVLASTCKAADPCTAYGASKLIAEKVVLNYSQGRVFRLVNVLGSSGSVIQIWDNIKDEVLPVVAAYRYWISPSEAVRFLLTASSLPSGLYAPNTDILKMDSVGAIANYYDPVRRIKWVPPRRGDRLKERVVAEYEAHQPIANHPSLMQIKEPWPRS